jgi:hypothetical protein
MHWMRMIRGRCITSDRVAPIAENTGTEKWEKRSRILIY